MSTTPIGRARAAYHLAARFLDRHGVEHPLARTLLALADRAAQAAYKAGHHVHDIHAANTHLGKHP
ncbi:hypothetical protein [Streptomyces lydicamycinicus]|uniref:hypothetical protein n=1 Tax=Streptomyces lydicamycinicus TaxID=1546107 RepID=UPI003C2DFFE4